VVRTWVLLWAVVLRVDLRIGQDDYGGDARCHSPRCVCHGAMLMMHHNEGYRASNLAMLEHAAFVSSHLKILKLSYALLDDNIWRQLLSHCPSLEHLDKIA
jgi:hypothetical protein